MAQEQAEMETIAAALVDDQPEPAPKQPHRYIRSWLALKKERTAREKE